MVVTPNYTRRSDHPPGLNYKCPACGGGTGVTDSRKSGAGIRRRRKCYTCGHRLTTMEVSADLFRELDVDEARKDVLEKINMMIESFNRLNRSIKASVKLGERP